MPLSFSFFFLQIRRLRIEIEKLQWLHQQELSEMKHNLGVNFISQRNRAVFFSPHTVQLVLPVFGHACVLQCRAYDGRDAAKSGAGEGEVGERGEETDGAGEAASSG